MSQINDVDGPREAAAVRRAVDRLGQVALFRDLDGETLAHVAHLARPRPLAHSALLDEPRDSTNSIYVLVRGRLRLYRRSEADREATLLILQAGDAFTFLAHAPDGRPMSEAMVLDHDALVYRFPKVALLHTLAAHPAAVLSLVDMAERIVAALCDLVAETVLYDVETRLARLLVRLDAAAPGRPIKLTHQELAWRVETRREEVTRLLRHFAHAKLIATRFHRHGIVVRDVAGLLQR